MPRCRSSRLAPRQRQARQSSRRVRHRSAVLLGVLVVTDAHAEQEPVRVGRVDEVERLSDRLDRRRPDGDHGGGHHQVRGLLQYRLGESELGGLSAADPQGAVAHPASRSPLRAAASRVSGSTLHSNWGGGRLPVDLSGPGRHLAPRRCLRDQTSLSPSAFQRYSTYAKSPFRAVRQWIGVLRHRSTDRLDREWDAHHPARWALLGGVRVEERASDLLASRPKGYPRHRLVGSSANAKTCQRSVAYAETLRSR